MATSGTVGLTRLNVQDHIDTALRRVGVAPSKGTPESTQIGLQILYTYLSALSNKGIPSWRIKQEIIGFVPYQRSYLMPVGAVQETNVNYRTITRPTGIPSSSAGGVAALAFDDDLDTACTQTAPDGNISIQYTTPLTIVSLGVMSNGTEDYDLVFEWSLDNVTWYPIYEPGLTTYPDRQWVYHDLTAARLASFFRVRETGGNILNLRELVFASKYNEVPMGRLNKDDYAAFNNKTFTSTNVNQYYIDRKRVQPEIFFYPVPSRATDQAVVWYNRQIEDPGLPTDILDVPARWFEAVQWNLAARIGPEVKSIFPDLVDMKLVQMAVQMAASAEATAWDADGDMSSSQMTIDISAYTS